MTDRRGFNAAGQLGNDGKVQDRAQYIPAYDSPMAISVVSEGRVGISWTEEDGQIPHKSGHEFHVSSMRRI